MKMPGNPRRIILLLLLLVVVLIPTFYVSGQSSQPAVHVVSVDGEITPAMASFLDDQITQANLAGADGIIIEISTLGGRVDAAIEMRDAIINSSAPVVVYIDDRAISAGALIAIAADTIIMAPGSHIGAAEPVPNEPKALAFVSGEFRTTAEKTGRDPEIAAAMVDKSIEIAGLVSKGEILDLTANEAIQSGYADYLAKGREEVLRVMGWENASISEAEPDFRYNIAQFLTSYEVAAFLLALGMICLIAELFIPGFGVAGVIGIFCFVLYFAGGFLAGHTELWSLLVFMFGVILLIIEIFVPGFGVFGIAGIIALIVGVIFAAPSLRQGIGSLAIALAAAIVAIPVFFKIFGRTKLIRRLVLVTAETTESGYTHAASKDSLLGKTGVTQTIFRPSGIVKIDGLRVNAIADGEFISQGVPVEVIRVEGTKVIVSPYN
jgi:membrane-bound serine protease (ClpP class)